MKISAVIYIILLLRRISFLEKDAIIKTLMNIFNASKLIVIIKNSAKLLYIFI